MLSRHTCLMRTPNITSIQPDDSWLAAPWAIPDLRAGKLSWIVAVGLADRCEVQLAYAIGVAEPVSVLVDAFGTAKVDPAFLSELVRSHFSLTPKGIIESLKLRRPIFKKTAAYGHFGRSDPDFTWEATDKAAKLASDAGVREPVAVRR